MQMDQDQQWLINCLNASLDPNHQVRNFAETSLNQASLQPAVLLKQYIKKHWDEDEDDFENPAVASNEKASIRGLLLSSLDDPNKKICTAVSVAVSTIAQYDWPDDWPELVSFLLSLISDQTKLNAVHGALRCLALLTSDMDDKMVPKIIPVLFPCLHTIVSSPQIYDKSLRSKAITIAYNCISIVGVMSGVYKTETTAFMLPMLQPWMEQFSLILQHPVPSEDPDDWSTRMEVLKCLNQFIQNFPSILETHFVVSDIMLIDDVSVIMGPLWQTFVSSLKVYERSSIEGVEDSYDGRYDSDGTEKSLESFVIQLFEFFLTVVGSPKFVKIILNNVKELVYYTIGFLQMTEQQVHIWSVDANMYVADEDDNTYSCRVSGALLLEEIITSCGMDGVDAVVDSIKRRISESQHQKDNGITGWWRLREATLFALASVSEQLLQVEVTSPEVGSLLEKILTDDMATGVHDYPFLHARLFSSVAKLSSVMNNQVTEHFLYAAIKTVGMDVPPAVKVGACRALSQLLPDSSKGIFQSHALDLLSSLVDLLKNATDETMHLVLETLQAAIKAGHEISASIEPVISPIILNMWASYVSDPFIGIDALEVLEAIKNSPGCIHPLVSRILPYVGPILSNPQQQPEGLVAGSLDLVTMLVKNAPIDVVKAAYQVSFESVVSIVLQSNDHSEMQNASQCLAALVAGGKQDMLAWCGDPGFIMKSLLDVVSRLLDPDLESSGSLFVGSYILQLILHLPTQMAHHIRDLVIALVRRMQSSQLAGLKSSLLLIFARLVHMSAPHVEQFIDLLVSVPAEGHRNSFVYLMCEWTKQQGEVQGSYQIKVTTTALALLLLTRHTALGNVNVQGYLIKAGITTRSRSKVVPDQWTMMPLPVKILALLADALLEAQEQVDGDDEDSDWEEAQTGDVSGDVSNKENFLCSAAATSHSRPSYEYLDAMAKVFNKINLVNYLVESLVKLGESDKPYFQHLFQSLNKPQQNAVELVLRQRGI
ncbi:hypothetical protein SASPL_110379 [Salvia splendens]|uniref:Importin N-terminal domain-containing protein n=1 Tax=Salvia splendens TaxID=180675 RepID=A0A8X9A3A8_SALSN|nr:hypothetical protein SASPL_110379 [Salvia splendens]